MKDWSEIPFIRLILFVATGAGLLFIPFLGGVHLFDWDEINFAEMSREMLVLDRYLEVWVNYKHFWEKPPLFLWFQAGSMKLFGVNEFSARFPNAICGIVTLISLMWIGKKLYNVRFGLVWAIVYAGTVLPHLYFRSGIIDPWFNYFIFMSYAWLFFAVAKRWKWDIELSQPTWVYVTIAGLINGLGILTKGQVALLVVGLCLAVYWAIVRFRLFLAPISVIWFIIMSTVVSLCWFGLDYYFNGPFFITEFLKYQVRLFSTPDAGHEGFPGYHFVVVFFGCFPSSILALRLFRNVPYENYHHRQFWLWMLIFFWVVIILFSIVKSKIVHYSSLTYFPVTFLAALLIHYIWSGKLKVARWQIILIGIIGGLVGIIVSIFPLIAMNKHILVPYIKDPFAVENLKANVRWTGMEALVGLFWLSVLIYTLYLFAYNRIIKAFTVLYTGMIVFIAGLIYVFPARIEPYSQGAAIEFFKSLQEKDCYMHTLSYRSYAQYFYGRPKVPTHANFYCKDTAANASLYEPECYKNWLLEGDIDKDAYFSTKITHADQYRTDYYKQLGMQELYAKNGFVFFKRTKPAQNKTTIDISKTFK